MEKEGLWGKSRMAKLMQAKKAMEDKKKMEAHGWSRNAERGTCGFCEQLHEQVYPTIIDVCEKCRDRATKAWTDKKIYFQIINVKPNIDMAIMKIRGVRCQACNNAGKTISSVNIKVCPKCMNDIGKRDHVKNTSRDQEVRIKRIEKNRIASRE